MTKIMFFKHNGPVFHRAVAGIEQKGAFCKDLIIFYWGLKSLYPESVKFFKALVFKASPEQFINILMKDAKRPNCRLSLLPLMWKSTQGNKH